MSKYARHVIVGGGITGLLHAWFAIQKGEQVIVLEKEDPGGLIQTKKTQCGLVETAANAIMNSSLFETIAIDLGLKIISANKAAKKRYIYFNNEYRRLPLSLSSKLRLFQGVAFRNAQPLQNESLADWARRVLGKNTVESLLQPAFGGIYAGDVEEMNASFVLKNRVITKGSMLKQLRVSKKQKKHLQPQIEGMVSPENGMGSFVQALHDYVTEYAQWKKVEAKGSISDLLKEFKADKITIATGLFGAQKLLVSEFNEIKKITSSLDFYHLVSVTRFGKKPLLTKPGFGVLFGPKDQIRARGILFNDSIFSGRVKEGLHSETFIYGGAFDRTIIDCSDATIQKQVEEDRSLLSKQVESPEKTYITRWKNALPAYNDALLQFNQVLDNVLPANIRVEGNFRYGIGLSSILERAAL